MAERPGVMFYFEVRPCLKRLTLEQKGALFEAILDYGEFGVVPGLDGVAAIAWDFIQPRIDKDGERYENTVKQREYAVYVREAKKMGQDPMTFEGWKSWKDNEKNRSLSVDSESYPTTTPTSTANTISISTSISETTAAESETECKHSRSLEFDPDIDFERKRQQKMQQLAQMISC